MKTAESEEEIGKEVKENNEKIVHCLQELKAQREELIFLIQKQREERKKLEMEMERLTYKICLINKSMAQRLKAKQNYDATIEEIEEKYQKLKLSSGELMLMVTRNCDQLDSMINKKTSTEDTEMKEADAETNTNLTSRSSSVKSQEDCVCLPNEDGRCIREKTVSKMVQAAPPVESDLPIKLEKEARIENQNKEKGAQTIVVGEPDSTTDDDDDDDREIENRKKRLGSAAAQYKETALRKP